MTVLAVGSCFIFDFDCDWSETGFLRQALLECEDLGKNPVSSIVREYRRVRRHRISSSAIEYLTAGHHTQYSLTVDRHRLHLSLA
ncbi:MAG: hypothetical protein HC942_23595 [Microcoleus sp. SU_5_6]|nr:hypothetical protein [Microcoleus sp. SU_5_6]NJS11764.1 hypothetical protein [Microcoleus sp. CSU_2_2]